MTFPTTITIICRDHPLLVTIDEPLQRSNIHADLQPSLQVWQAVNAPALCQLLVIDLALLPGTPPLLLEKFARTTENLLLIPTIDSAEPGPLPSNTTLLKRRSAQLLIDGIRTLLGIPARIFERRPFESDILIRPQDAAPFEARCYDLGPGGVFIESFHYLSAGSRVTLRFKNTPFSCEGCIAWQHLSSHRTHPRYETGIQFLFPDRNQLAQLLKPTSP